MPQKPRFFLVPAQQSEGAKTSEEEKKCEHICPECGAPASIEKRTGDQEFLVCQGPTLITQNIVDELDFKRKRLLSGGAPSELDEADLHWRTALNYRSCGKATFRGGQKPKPEDPYDAFRYGIWK